MKNLIVYASKYGFTEDCAFELREKLKGETKLLNIKGEKPDDIASYDNVIIGGSVYAGQFQGNLKKFATDNLETLKSKRLGFFVCAGSGDNLDQSLQSAFPKELLDKAFAKDYFGGEFRLDRMGFFSKMIIKMVSNSKSKNGEKSDTPTKRPENINAFADKVNQL